MPEGTESDGAERAESKGAERAESKGDESAESKGDESVSVEEARREIAGGDAIAVDVRSDEDWGEGHIPGAIHLPDGDPDQAAKPLEKGARLLVIAEKGKLAARAATELAEKGYDAAAVDGTMKDWSSEGYSIQPTDDPDEDTELGAG
jgi:rhodanese-related sulfurtransferase